MAKRWPAVKKRTAAKSLDPLPGRKQCFGTALHKAGLGAARGNPDIGPRLQLEEVVALGGTGLSIGWPALPVMVSDPARQLQRREPHRLCDLKRHLRGQKAILIWDGLPAHKSLKMKQYLESQSNWLQVEMLPGYSPDLNPVEDLWGNLKGRELAKRCVDGLGEAEQSVWHGMERVRQSTLSFSFLHHAGLFF